MKIISGSLRNATAVWVGIILTLLFGWLAFRSIPIQLNPTIETPYITVETSYPGASANEIEQELTRRQEERLAAVENLREMRSTSREGRSEITMKFDWGVDKDLRGLDVLKKLNMVRDKPLDAEEPQILFVNRREEETIMFVNMRVDPALGLSVDQLFELVDDGIRPMIERVEGVSYVRIFGGAEREIQVLIDPEKMAARGIPLGQVARVLARENRNVRGGDIETGHSRLIVRTPAQFSNLEQIRQTVIAQGADGPVRVSDVGEVVDSFKKRQVMARADGITTVFMAVVKQSGANTLEVATQVKAKIEEINRDLESRGMLIHIAHDDSDYIWDSINRVRDSLLLGALLAIGVLWIFLRSVSSTAILGLTIPVCMIGTFVLLAAFGRSINVISLAGLAFASGLIVDNGIVVIENIYRHRAELGKTILMAAYDGAREVWAPVVAATLTTLAVFLPILFIQEESGQLFRDIAYSISFAVGLSMISSITIVPMLASRMMGRLAVRTGSRPAAEPIEPGGGPLRRWAGRLALVIHRVIDPVFDLVARMVVGAFSGLVELGLRSRLVLSMIIVVILGVFLFSLQLVPPAEYLPMGNRNRINVRFTLPAGMSLDGAAELISVMEQRVLQTEGLERAFVVMRAQGPFIGVALKRDRATKENIQRVVGELRAFAAEHFPAPDVVAIVSQSSVFGGGSGKRIDVDIRGPDLRRLEELSNTVNDRLRAIPGVMGVRPSLDMGNPELQVIPDRERLADLGINAADIAEAVEILVEGRRTSLYRMGGKEYDLTLKAYEELIGGPEGLAAVTLALNDGRRIRLGDVARVETRLGPVSIEHLEQERSVTLQVNIEENVPLETVIATINEEVIAPLVATLPLSYSISLSGSADDLARTIRALSTSFLLALIIIYLLMSALFRSFFYPAIIMFSVPPAMTGAFLALYLSGAEFNVITMLGLILLAGVVVNNAILLVDVTLREVRAGRSHVAAIREAVRRRLRPIFMSSVTSVLGMAPLALGQGAGAELYKGLGVALVGGLCLSTVFTLLLIPMLLRVFLHLRDRLARGLGREDLTEVGTAKRLAELDAHF